MINQLLQERRTFSSLQASVVMVESTRDIVCSRVVRVLECDLAVDQSYIFLQQRLLSATPERMTYFLAFQACLE